MKDSILTLYHGSSKIVGKPVFGLGKTNNDYGLGFYCTQDIELAKEWACPEDTDGYANIYRLNTRGLGILDLESPPYSILHWITILLENRTFDPQSDFGDEAKTFLIDNFHIDTSEFDIIRGWRADDSYFSYANRFINSNLSVQNLRQAMELGNLGTQIVLKSKKAFDRIEFEGCDTADASIYSYKRKCRDDDARAAFREGIRTRKRNPDDVYILDLLDGRVNVNDPRIF